jgi:hypothetical protein
MPTRPPNASAPLYAPVHPEPAPLPLPSPETAPPIAELKPPTEHL